MTAPTPTARGTPGGTMLENGYQSLITFSTAPTIGLYEKTVTPVGLEGGDKVDISTMHNVIYKTAAAQALIELTDSQMTVGYDPGQLLSIVGLINQELSGGNATVVTQTFADGSSWAYFGYLKSFAPGALSNGAHPDATCTIVATNRDELGAEQAPVYTVAAP